MKRFTAEQVEFLKGLGYADIEDRLGDKKPKPVPSMEFEEAIYHSYPRKVGKPAALRAIRRARKKHSDATLIRATAHYMELWRGKDLQYCPHPSTWFNQERFLDSPETWSPREDQNALYRNLERLRATTEDQIYRHVCNVNSPHGWRIAGKPEPDEQLRAEYAELKEKLNDLKRRVGELSTVPQK